MNVEFNKEVISSFYVEEILCKAAELDEGHPFMSCNSNTFLDVRHSLLQSNFEIRFIIQLQNLEGCRGPSPSGIIHAPTKCHRPSVRPSAGADGSISHTGREGGDALNDRKRASDRIQVNSIQRSQHSADRQMAEMCKMQR